jgi:hypothetical protein
VGLTGVEDGGAAGNLKVNAGDGFRLPGRRRRPVSAQGGGVAGRAVGGALGAARGGTQAGLPFYGATRGAPGQGRQRQRAGPGLWLGMAAGPRWAKRGATAGWWAGLAGVRK